MTVRVETREEAAGAPRPKLRPASRIEEPKAILEPLAGDALTARFGNEAKARSATDRLQENSVALNQRLHGLRRISERYPEESVARFSPEAKRLFAEFVRERLREIRMSVRDDQSLLREVLPALPATEPARAERAARGCAGWRSDTRTLQAGAAENEKLYWRLFGVVRAAEPDGISLTEAVNRVVANEAA